MVKFHSTLFRSDDTSGVSLKHGFVGLNSYRDGLFSNSFMESLGVHGGHVVERFDSDNTITFFVLASV
jgi:hypothetical protein